MKNANIQKVNTKEPNKQTKIPNNKAASLSKSIYWAPSLGRHWDWFISLSLHRTCVCDWMTFKYLRCLDKGSCFTFTSKYFLSGSQSISQSFIIPYFLAYFSIFPAIYIYIKLYLSSLLNIVQLSSYPGYCIYRALWACLDAMASSGAFHIIVLTWPKRRNFK